nr:MAG TPA: hypothetical protein [Bacteriophage sp.]
MVVSAKNVILNTTLDMRAGMDTIKIHLPEKYLKDINNTLYVKVNDIVNGDQFFSKEFKNATNPIEITMHKNLSGYTGDVYITFSSLPEFKFYFTLKNDKSTVYPEKTSKSFYPSDTVFINRIPVVELTEIKVDEIKENSKADAKTVINLEEIRKGLFANPEGKYLNFENGYSGVGSHPGDWTTALEYNTLVGLLNSEPDSTWTRILDNAQMRGAMQGYKKESLKSENVSFYDYIVFKLTNKYQGDINFNSIEDNLLSRVIKQHDELVRIVKQLAATANIEHTLDNPFGESE